MNNYKMVIFKLVFTVFVLTLQSFGESGRVRRIVSGDYVPCNRYPYVASLTRSSQHICGATLLTTTHAVTAAHCVENTSELYNLQFYNRCINGTVLQADVTGIITHPLYKWYDNAHDIAILNIDMNVLMKDELNWINGHLLPTSSLGVSGDCTALGYGTNTALSTETSHKLSSALQTIISLDECGARLGPYVAPSYDGGMMCAVGKGDACGGDSGGPLICQGRLEGIISYGQSCGVPDLPAVYTSIRAHLSWINMNIINIEHWNDPLYSQEENSLVAM